MPNLPVPPHSGSPTAASDLMATLLSGAANPNAAGQSVEQVFDSILTGMMEEAPAVEDDTDTENLALALPVEAFMAGMTSAPPASEPQSVPEAAPEELLSMLSANVMPTTGYSTDHQAADESSLTAGDVLLPTVTPTNPSPNFGDSKQYTTIPLQAISQTHAAPPPAESTAGNNSAGTLFTPANGFKDFISPVSEHPDPIHPVLAEGHIQQEFDSLSPHSKPSDLINNPAISTANFADSGKILLPGMSSIVHASNTPFIDSTKITNDAPTVAAEFGHPDWPEEFGQKITWLATQRMQAAELKLHPAHLGPIEISLQISADQQLTAHFISHHAGVRDAIEANLPRLRELMAENGITLADTSVSADTPNTSGQQTESGQQPPPHPAANGYFHYDSADPQQSPTLQIVRRSGIIDTFA